MGLKDQLRGGQYEGQATLGDLRLIRVAL